MIRDRLFIRVFLAALIVCAALGLRLQLSDYLGQGHAFLTFYPAIMMVALICGTGPGGFAAILSAGLADYFFIEPRGTLAIREPMDQAGLFLFVFSSAIVSMLAGFISRSRIKERRRFLFSGLNGRERESRFEQMVSSLPQLVWSCNSAGEIDYLSPKWTEFTGIPAALQLGSEWLEQVHPDDRPLFKAAWEKAVAGSSDFKAEFRLCRHDGVYRWFHALGVPLKDSGGRVTKWLGSNTDITEKLQIEYSLRESQRRLNMAHQAAKMGAFEWNIQTGVAVWTPEMENMYGLAAGQFGRSREEWEKLIHPDDRTRARLLVDRAFHGSELVEGEWRVVWPDGSVHWINGRFQCSKDCDGRPLRLSGINMDVTERKLAQDEQLRLTNEIQFITNLAEVGHWNWEIAANRINWSPSCSRLFGFTESDPVSHSILMETVYPDDRARVKCAIEDSLRSGKPYDAEFRIIWPDKNVRWIHSKGKAVMSNGKAERMVGISVDITEHKRADEALKAAQEQTKADLEAMTRLQELANLSLAERNMEEILTAIVDTAIAISGADFGNIQLVDSSSGDLRMVAQRGFPDWWLEYWREAGKGRGVTGTALEQGKRLVIDDISESSFLPGSPLLEAGLKAGVQALQSTPLFSRSGKPLGIFSTHYRTPHRVDERMLRFLDILSRQAADAIERVQTEQGLLRAEKERREFEAHAQRAQRLESIGVLAGGIAHDFNNLLGGLFGYLDLAMMSSRQGASEKSVNYLQKALGALSSARNLTRQLLTFSKGGAPSMKVESLPEMLRDAAVFTLSGSNIHVDLNVPDDLCSCRIDLNQIRQALDNILINAKQAMPEGGKVFIKAEEIPTLEALPKSLRPGHYVRISVTDQGHGMVPEIIDRIFDPFFTTKESGRGLGLSIAYSIVKKHGGIVEVSSEVNKGSTFGIYLPATAENSKVAARKIERHPPAEAQKKRVLVMDDEEMIREAVGTMLEELGCSVAGAGHGEEAISLYQEALAASSPFDLVILDLTIKNGLGGYDTIKRLLQVDPSVRAVVSTGYSNDPVVSNPEQFGFKAALPKPFVYRQLKDLLSRFSTRDTEDVPMAG